jgi:hypothetical protein
VSNHSLEIYACHLLTIATFLVIRGNIKELWFNNANAKKLGVFTKVRNNSFLIIFGVSFELSFEFEKV